MTEECPVCKMKVELTKVQDHPDYKGAIIVVDILSDP
jgi:YHS domain-containing protein